MIKILFTGDFYPNGRIKNLSINKNQAEIFNDFLPFCQESDINVTNLECPLLEEGIPIEKIGPALKASPDNTIETLKFAGFNIVTLANNHIMDYGEKGILSTIEECKKHGIDYVGGGKNYADARKIFYKKIKGIKIAFLNFSENEFSTTNSNQAGANPLSIISNFHDIVDAKKEADFVFVIIHGGNELYALPSPRVKETYRFFAEAGADFIISHHTHYFSGYEIYNDVPIFYGLGNFLFDGNSKDSNWTSSFAVQLMIKDGGIKFKLIPFIQNDSKAGIRLLEKGEHIKFDEKISKLNEIILNDQDLNDSFQELIKRKEKQYSHFIEPYTNKYLHGLKGRNIIPSMLSHKKRNLLLNLIRCEAHRDILIEILKP